MGMDFAITFRGDHVHVELDADPRIDDPELPKDYWGMLRKICEEHDCRRVLVEGLVPSGDLEATEVVEAGERTAAVPNLWLAFNLKDHVPDERSELYEAVAASKGVRVKFFDNAADALNWLRANAPK